MTDIPLKQLSAKSGGSKRWLLHVFRVSVFVLIVIMIRLEHASYQRARQSSASTVGIEQIRQWLPDAKQFSDTTSDGGRLIVGVDDRVLGVAIETMPKGKSIVGYSGPNNVLLVFDARSTLLGIELLYSGDTPEHVDMVLEDEFFLTRFNGKTWNEIASSRNVGGVSGATLTSYAIAESIVYRLGGEKPSYRFPKALALADVKPFFDGATSIRQSTPLTTVIKGNEIIGYASRTSPAADAIMGYQGPTDTLVLFDADKRVKRIAVRRSYDNEEYVDYVREDGYFPKLFNGKTIEDLSTLDLAKEQVEGVSGATMTSVAMAEGLVRFAQQSVAQSREARKPAMAIMPRDIGTAIVVALALLIAFTPLRRMRALRVVFQLVLIVYLGFINGDMLSQAVVVGWAQSQVPWRIAPGMVLLVAGALAVPLLTRKQTYCHHMCPHGALQELVRKRLPWSIKLPKRIVRLLRLIPIALLAWVLAVAMLHLPFSVVNIEPFDAWVFTVAGWATITVAIVGLVASLFVPMAYCRFGCPTGVMLNFLRFSGTSDGFGRRDMVAAGLLIAAVAMHFI